MFTIETLSNRILKAGKFETVEQFVVVDENGQPVVSRTFSDKEEAQKAIDGLGNLAIGVEFARAQFPDQADKAQKGKAALIAAYLDWEAAGRPVQEAKPEQAEEATEAEAGEAPQEAKLSDVEDF